MNMELSKKRNIKRVKKSAARKPGKKVISKRKKRLIFRRFSLISICLLVVFSFLFGLYFLLSKVFSIKNISIQGDSEYSEAEIISAGEVGIGSSMLFLNSKNIENKIYKSLANIDEVKISKKFPNKLIVSVEEAIPAYHLKVENEYFVISSKNKFLMKSLEVPQDTIGVIGLEAEIKNNGKVEYKDAEKWQLFEEILSSFKNKGLENINEVDISDLQNIILIYENRLKINIGNKEDIDYKILTLKEIIDNKISKTEKGVLNLKDLKAENRTYFTYE